MTCGEARDDLRRQLIDLSVSKYLFARLYARYWLRRLDASDARMHKAQQEFLRQFLRS
jgi:hypothetical protein